MDVDLDPFHDDAKDKGNGGSERGFKPSGSFNQEGTGNSQGPKMSNMQGTGGQLDASRKKRATGGDLAHVFVRRVAKKVSSVPVQAAEFEQSPKKSTTETNLVEIPVLVNNQVTQQAASGSLLNEKQSGYRAEQVVADNQSAETDLQSSGSYDYDELKRRLGVVSDGESVEINDESKVVDLAAIPLASSTNGTPRRSKRRADSVGEHSLDRAERIKALHNEGAFQGNPLVSILGATTEA